MKQRIAIYCRVSSLDQARYGFSLNDQERRINTYLSAMKEPDTYVIEVFREEGVSAKNTRRPELKRLLKKVSSHEIDEVYILTLSRLTRNVSDLCSLIETFNANNVQFTSLTEQIDTKSAHGRFFVYLLGCLAQLEREEISERSKRGLEESALEGNYPIGNKPPIGYKRNGKKLVPDDSSASVVQDIFHKIAYEDYSVYLLSIYLNSANVCNVKWNTTKIYSMIHNPIYYGTLDYGTLHLENHTPALVDKELWIRANNMLKHYQQAIPGKYIFRSYAICPKCGKRLSGRSTVKKKTQKRYLYYYCYGCGKNYSEIKMMKALNTELSEQLRIKEYGKYLSSLCSNQKRFASDLSKLNYARINSYLADDYYQLEMQRQEKEWSNVLKNLRYAYGKVKNMSFRKLSYSEQRKFLAETVKEIQVEFDTKKIRIIWK